MLGWFGFSFLVVGNLLSECEVLLCRYSDFCLIESCVVVNKVALLSTG